MHLWKWMYDNKETYPKFVLKAGIIATGIVLATIAMTAIHTGFGRIAEDIILQAGTALLLIAFLCVVLFMLWGVHLSLKYRAETAPPESQEPKAIPSENRRKWQPLSIAPDTLFYQTNGESMADFAKRVSAFTPTNAEWGVLIKRGELQATVFKKSGGIHFQRGGGEPFWDMLKEGEGRPPADFDFKNETQEEYEKYCYWFTMHYPAWAGVKKYEYDPENAHQTAVDILNAQAKTAVLTISFLLFCLPVFGQSKTRQVDEALGTRIREIPGLNEKVTFVFREGSKEKYYERTGDGVSDYTTLLQTTSGLVRFEDEGGQFVAVSKNGEVVARGPHVERVNEQPKLQNPMGANRAPYLQESTTGDPIRPRGILQAPDAGTPVMDKPLNIHIPTPGEVQTTLDNASREIDYRKSEAWEAIKPIWRWIMGLFFSIVPLLICFGGMFRYYAGTAANEAFYGLSWIGVFIRRVHETASGITLLICWAIFTVLLIDEFMLFVYFGIPIWAMLLTWFPSLYFAKIITNWIVPDPPGVAVRGRFNDPYEQQRRLG